MEDISSKRKPIQKVDAMNPHDFLKFLREFIPYVKDGRVDLNDIRITEKIDGQALKLLTQNGEMMFESSYSGVTSWDKVPMKDAANFLYKNYSQLFNDIYEIIKCDFKLIGELIWIDEMEETGKVTPVGASYLTEKFGKFGGIVIFDILKIEDDKLVPFEDDRENEIFDMIRDLNNEDFSFYLSESIDITKNVTFELDINEIYTLLNNPDFNKPRFDKKNDAKLLEEIERIKANVCAQLSRTIDSTKGAFSAEGDLIEGIVLKINSSGNQYGMFSEKYKETKNKYWDLFKQIDLIWNEFFKETFGCVVMRKKKDVIPKLETDFNYFKDRFELLRPIYFEKMKRVYDNLENNNEIPKAMKKVQVSMAKNQLNKLQESNYENFIKKFILLKEND